MRTYILLASLLFLACNGRSPRNGESEKDTVQISIWNGPYQKDSSYNPGSSLLLWTIDIGKKTKRKNPDQKNGYPDADSLIKGLNEMYPEIILEKVRISGDTLFTKIRDSEYLAERIGTTGAATYLADAVINLTSVKGVNYVSIDFREGSHASPGTWSSDDFSDYKIIP